MIEVDASTGQIVENPNIIARGFSSDEARTLSRNLSQELKKEFQQRKGAVKDWIRIRKITGKISEAYIYKNFKKHPLVLPVVVEV